MKVLQISNYLYPNIGGIEQVARDIANTLSGVPGVEQKILCFNTDARDGDTVTHQKETVRDTVDGVEVLRCSSFAKLRSQSLSTSFGRELRCLMDSFDPDIVVFHYPNPFEAHFLLAYIHGHPGWESRHKLVLYWHLDIVKQKLLGKLFHAQTLELLRLATQVVATSPNYIEGSKYLSRFRNKCRVIPNCISESRMAVTDSIRARTEELRRAYGEDKVLCFGVGRHIPYKGFSCLVEASRYLDDRFVLLIGGKGELTDTLKTQAAGDDKVHFLGRISDEDLIAYDLACDIFCFPSITKNEAFGIALAEGMSFGKPAVTFTIPGSGVNYVNLDGVTGIECPNADSRAYAAALTRLADDPQLRLRYGEAAARRVRENFLFSQFKANIRTLFDDVRALPFTCAAATDQK